MLLGDNRATRYHGKGLNLELCYWFYVLYALSSFVVTYPSNLQLPIHIGSYRQLDFFSGLIYPYTLHMYCFRS